MEAATLEQISRLLQRNLGGARWRRLDAGRAGTRVWLLELAEASWIIKRHAEHRGFAQERRALREWRDARMAMPRLLADDEAARLLILERVPGRSLAEPSADAWRRAGEFLAALHGLAIVDDDPLSLAEAMPRRLRAWARSGELRLEPSWRELISRLELAAPRTLAGLRRVACHRDFTPGNWLWEPGPSGEVGRLWVVDFEHSRLDLDMVDLAKLAPIWAARPDLATAFWAGYGRREADLRESLGLAIALHGLASLAWGRRHADAGFVAEGARALDLALGMV